MQKKGLNSKVQFSLKKIGFIKILEEKNNPFKWYS